MKEQIQRPSKDINQEENDFFPKDKFSGELEKVNYLSHLFYCFLPKINAQVKKFNMKFSDLWRLDETMQHDINSVKFKKYYHQ
jgi:hypothetical protein